MASYFLDMHIRFQPPTTSPRFKRSTFRVEPFLKALVAACLFGWTDTWVTLVHKHTIQAFRIRPTWIFLINFALASGDFRKVSLVDLHVTNGNISL